MIGDGMALRDVVTLTRFEATLLIGATIIME